jgi:hypothetical protein
MGYPVRLLLRNWLSQVAIIEDGRMKAKREKKKTKNEKKLREKALNSLKVKKTQSKATTRESYQSVEAREATQKFNSLPCDDDDATTPLGRWSSTSCPPQ